MERSRIAVIIPAYNEAASIGEVVRKILPLARPVVVDDASMDETAAMASNAGAMLLRNEKNGGYDKALCLGFKEAEKQGFDFAITMDADGQHDPALIGKYVALLEENADLVVGIRPQTPRISEKLFALTTRLLYGIRDPLCGMKGYRLSLYKDAGRFDSYGSTGTELTLFAAKNGYTIKQIPIPIYERNGKTRFGKSLRAEWKIIRSLLLSFFKVKRSRRIR